MSEPEPFVVVGSDAVLEQALSDNPAPPARHTDLPALRPRLCGALGCATHLSRYNSTSTCWLHGPGSNPMLRSR